MIGVILAAGVGSRLRPMTNNKPKCLVTSAGQPILQYQLDTYKEAGIKDLVIVVGYESQAIKDYCKHNKDFNISIIENDIYEDTNNMYSFYLAKDYVAGRPFILNNADLTVDSSLVCRMLADPREDLVAVDTGLFNHESMKVSLNKNKKIVDISKQIEEDDSFGCSIDFYKFSEKSSSRFFEEISRVIEVEENLKDWTEVAMQNLFKSQELRFEAFDIQNIPWVEIDNYADLALSDSIFSQRNKKISDYSAYCFDLDGTIYVGNKKIEGAAEVLRKLEEKGKKLFFITNNSSKNKADYCERLAKIGVNSLESQVILSSDATISYLQRNQVKKVFVLGTKSLKKMVLDAGIDLCSHSPEFVVVGYDTDLNYEKLVDACRLINKGVDYIATHCDPVCPSEHGPIPDIGVITKMLEDTTGRKVFKVFGKPNKELIEGIIESEGLDRSEVLMVGDRLYTDIKMAKSAKIDSLLVLSGDTNREEVELQPNLATYVLNNISDIYK